MQHCLTAAGKDKRMGEREDGGKANMEEKPSICPRGVYKLNTASWLGTCEP